MISIYEGHRFAIESFTFECLIGHVGFVLLFHFFSFRVFPRNMAGVKFPLKPRIWPLPSFRRVPLVPPDIWNRSLVVTGCTSFGRCHFFIHFGVCIWPVHSLSTCSMLWVVRTSKLPTKGHFTHEPRAVTMKLWEPKRKMSKGRPKTPPKSYSVVMDPQA